MFEAQSHSRSAFADSGGGVPGLDLPGALDFQKLLVELWRGKFTILMSVVAVLVLAVVFILLVPHKYTATTQILIDPTDLRATQNEVALTNPQNDAVAVLQVESQARVIMSDSVLRRVVASEGLDHDPEFALGAMSLEYGALSALDGLKKHITIKRAERTYVIDVSVTSKDPAKAARIANAIAQAYLAEQTEVRADAARQISQALSARLKELQDRVRDSEDKVEAYKSSHNIVGANGELVDEQQLSNLTTQLGLAHARTAEAKARLDQIESVQKSKTDIGAFPEAVQSQTISALRTQYADVMRREAEQKTQLGERHPAVIEIEAQAERLQKMIADEVSRIAAAARTDYESARTNEDTLARNLDTLKHNAMSTNESLVGLRELEREVQANRAVYEAFLVRARETGEQERVDTKNIRVISKADLPLYRSWPPRNLYVLIAALFLGGAIGVGLVLLRAMYGEAWPRLNVASLLPEQIGDAPARIGATAKRYWPGPARSPSIPVLATLPSADVSYGLNAVENPQSRFAREIQKVYEVVRTSHRKRGNPSVLVVAADDEDETASVALSLAAAAAATERVLLIDADLERRTLTAIDAEEGDGGLVDVAVGRRQLSDVIVRDRDTNVNLVPFVAASSRRDRRITDRDIKTAFDKTRRFDMVIVAAVNMSRDPSSAFFADLVDHIVIVARPDRDNKRAVEQFVSRLGPDAAKVRGAVLTGVETA